MDKHCQELIDKCDGKVVHSVGPDDYIHPAILDVVDHMVGDDPRWTNNPSLSSYRHRKATARKNKPLRTQDDKLQSYLKQLEKSAKQRRKYASTGPKKGQ